MFKKIIIIPVFIFLSYYSILLGQVKLDGQFFEYSSYYISDFNVLTGESNVPLFRYRLYANNYPMYTKIQFKSSFISSSLGIKERQTLIKIESNVFNMKESIILDNRNFSANTTMLLDQSSPPNMIPIQIRLTESINSSILESLMSTIMTTGKLPDGEYRFELKVFSGLSKEDVYLTDQDSKTIIVESNSGINLESPGGMLSDTSYNSVYTTYPVFNWVKGGCNNCDTYFRLAEFKIGYHSSMEEAMRDERMLPFNQSKNWFKLSDVSTYQYPISDARPLEYGKIYVWQIKAEVPTTSGYEDELSAIYSFKIVNPSETASSKTQSLNQLKLNQALGEDQYNALFGQDGSLYGFNISDKIILNNSNINEAILNRILSDIRSKKVVIKSLSIKE